MNNSVFKAEDLVPGDVIVATKDLDVDAAFIRKGTTGVVIRGQQSIYKNLNEEHLETPLVRWMNMALYGVYDDDFSVINKMY